MAITIECREHPDYDGETKPDTDCRACQSLRAWILALAPADVAGLTQDALALGALAVRDGWGGHVEPQGAPHIIDETNAYDGHTR